MSVKDLQRTANELEKHGWNNYHSDFDELHYKHPDFPGHKIAVLRSSGSLDHYIPGTKEPKYVSGYQVKSYVKAFHKPSIKEVNAHNLIFALDIMEAAYPSNIGFHELVKFHQVATPEESDEMDRIVKSGDWEKFKKHIKKVTGMKLE